MLCWEHVPEMGRRGREWEHCPLQSRVLGGWRESEAEKAACVGGIRVALGRQRSGGRQISILKKGSGRVEADLFRDIGR